MKPSARGYRVAVVGASSLLGKELLSVLKERNFPIGNLVAPETGEEELELPILDLDDSSSPGGADEDLTEQDLDLAFLAARPKRSRGKPSPTSDDLPFLRCPKRLAASTHCVVIDASESLAGHPGGTLSVPFLEGNANAKSRPAAKHPPGYFVSAHPAVIVLSSLLLRLAANFRIKNAVAQVFSSASEMGSAGLEELQKQTTGLLSFQKIPQAVFGQQLAFNLSPRLGRGHYELALLEKRVRNELSRYLEDRAPLPALRLLPVPVFHSLACSLYVETVEPASPEALGKALTKDRVSVRRPAEQAPSLVEAAGSSDILVDVLTPDAAHPAGIWIWAAADNLRLAALNAVEIAERVKNSDE